MTFTVNPAVNGAGGSFTGGNTAVTNPSGIATANPFTANGIAGAYTVTASVSGVVGVATFNLTNTGGVTVVSYNVLWGTQTYNVTTSPRVRLPWQITGIQVVFSRPGHG